MTGSVAVALRPELQAPPDRHRETLVRRFADLLFLPTERASPFEKGLVDEILSRLYPSLDPAMQQKLARRLSELSDPPRRVTRLMAADRPEIAQLFLERVELFDEAELVTLIAATGVAHHAMIARRANLSRVVTGALVATQHPEIIETLLTHRGAVFSADVYRVLAALSRGDAAYQELLLSRADLPAALAHEMFWWVGAPLRRAILQRYSMERRLLVEAVCDLDLTLSAAPADVYWAFRFSGASRPRLRVEGDEMEALGQWLGGAPEERFAATLAEALAIDAATVGRILRDKGGEALTVLLKAVGLSASQFKTLGPLIAARLGALDPARLAELSALFETLSTDWADLVLRLWDQQGAGQTQAD